MSACPLMLQLVQISVCFGLVASAGGQIVFDGSMGAAGELVPSGVDGKTLAVGPDRGTTVGPNLFHSFSKFTVPDGSTAVFEGNAGLSNILARVTGKSASEINGTIATDKTSAKLFLMNPNGIMFGPKAQVNVNGAFLATTADYIQMADGSLFTASRDGATTLTSAAPSAFGFLSALPDRDGNISLHGAISESSSGIYTWIDQRGQVGERNRIYHREDIARAGWNTEGHDLALIGRAIILEDSVIETRGGDLSLVAVGPGAELVPLDHPTRPEPGERPGSPFSGDVTLTRSVVSAAGPKEQGSGGIRVAGGEILHSGESFLRKTVLVPRDGDPSEDQQVFRSGVGIATDGVLHDGTNALVIQASDKLMLGGLARVQSLDGNGLPGADIVIDVAGQLGISDDGAVLSSVSRSGPGGKISIWAGSLDIDGGETSELTGILTTTRSSGAGGDVIVKVDGHVAITDVGQITSFSIADGTGGSIELFARSLTIHGAENIDDDPRPNFFLTGINSKSELDSSGTLGNVTVEVDETISLTRGGLIDATTFSNDPKAAGGQVMVTASEIIADRANSLYFTGIGSNSALGEGGSAGGRVEVRAGRITLLNGAQIAANTRGGAAAGDILVVANRINASGVGRPSGFVLSEASGIVAGSQGKTVDFPDGSSGNAGQVEVRQQLPGTGGDEGATPSINLSDGGEIAARAEGSGNGGNVLVKWDEGSIRVESGGRISARSGTEGGEAGSVRIEARDVVLASGGAIESQNEEPDPDGPDEPGMGGDAGGVELVLAGNLTMDEGVLRVSSAGGDAGTLRVSGGELLQVNRSQIEAEAWDDGGNITVNGGRYLLLDKSLVSANAENGDGGNIDITTDVFLANESEVTASSRFGAAGVVRIDPQVVLSGNEGEIEVDPLKSTDSLQPECTNRLPTKAGSFIKAGRGGTRRLPGGYLPSLRLVDAGGP